MRRAAHVDRNQKAVMDALRKAGITVEPLHMVGGGCPDLLCGLRGVNVLLEVKDGARFASERQLNKMQTEWHQHWNGQCAIAETSEDAIRIVIEETMRRGKI